MAPPSARSPTKERRAGAGSTRGLRGDCLVRPTGAGRLGHKTWPALFGEVEQRWASRFGASAVADLRESSASVVGRLDVELPEYVPIVASTDGFVAGFSPRRRRGTALSSELGVLLAQVLLAYTIDFEQASELPLPLSENVVRVLGEAGRFVREIPAAAGISKEATRVSFTSLAKSGYVSVEGSPAAARVARLTASGEEAWRRSFAAHRDVGGAWTERFGADELLRLTSALEHVLHSRELAEGLRPYPEGWRASKPYLARTEALLADPLSTLPRYPMVLHRGGWPDGS